MSSMFRFLVVCGFLVFFFCVGSDLVMVFLASKGILYVLATGIACNSCFDKVFYCKSGDSSASVYYVYIHTHTYI